MFAVKQMFGTGPFKKGFAAFKRLPIEARAVALSLVVGVLAYGGAKPGTNEMERASSPLVVLMSSGEQMAWNSKVILVAQRIRRATMCDGSGRGMPMRRKEA